MSIPSDPDAAPPPYTASPSSPPSSTSAAPSYRPADPSLYTSHLSQHLTSLPQRIRAAHRARATEQQVRDLRLVTLLVPEVESFLSDIGEGPNPPRVAELNLVPAGAVGREWKLSGAQERRREGETVQLVRVRGPEPCRKGDSKGRTDYGTDRKGGSRREEEEERDWDAEQFDEWGRWEDEGSSSSSSSAEATWWWRDEAMARRLAGHLQPQTQVKTERREIAAAVQQAKEEKRSWGGWGRKKSEPKPAPAAVVVSSPVAEAPPTNAAGDGVSMTVRADEITFRRENEMGIWESMSGWGLVVTLRIRRP